MALDGAGGGKRWGQGARAADGAAGRAGAVPRVRGDAASVLRVPDRVATGAALCQELCGCVWEVCRRAIGEERGFILPHGRSAEHEAGC